MEGGNYGWIVREGAHCFSPASGCADTFIEPITEVDYGQGRSITGGFVYRGSAITELVGWYVFGDCGSGRFFAIHEAYTTATRVTVLTEAGAQIVSFGQGDDGEIYLLDFSSGSIRKIVDAP